MVQIPRSACSMRVIGLPFVIGVVTGTVLGFTSGAFVCGGASDAEGCAVAAEGGASREA